MKPSLKKIQGAVGAIEISTPPNTIFKPTPPSPLFEIKRGERVHSCSLPKAGESTYTPSLLKRGLGGVGQSKFGIIVPGGVQ